MATCEEHLRKGKENYYKDIEKHFNKKRSNHTDTMMYILEEAKDYYESDRKIEDYHRRRGRK